MSTVLTMSTYFNNDLHRNPAWQKPMSPRYENEQRRLPSIYDAVPELLVPVHQDAPGRVESSAASPGSGLGFGARGPPAYVQSPSHSKRRRLSLEGDMGIERAGQATRQYGAPPQHDRLPHSPVSARMSSESGDGAIRGIAYSMDSPSRRQIHVEGGRERAQQRPTLPSLSFPILERDHGEVHGMGSRPGSEYQREPFGQPSKPHSAGYRPEPGASAYTPVDMGYGHYPPARNHSLSVGSIRSYDRPPFSAGPYGHSYPEQYHLPAHIGEIGIGGVPDNKHRKRRGNLPKETTDKLRHWFSTHLDHPYPSEDEKQELMRQTGLLMNQISNWFINARRRQLPALQRNAQAESYALAGRNGDGNNVLGSGERDSVPLSDGETNNYDDGELGGLDRRRSIKSKHGSI